MRRLKTSDLFAFLRIASEAHLRDEVEKIADTIRDNGADADAQKVGYNLILTALEHLGAKRAETSVYEFLGGIWEMPPQEVADLDLLTFRDTFKTWSTEYVNREELRGFFGALSTLMR